MCVFYASRSKRSIGRLVAVLTEKNVTMTNEEARNVDAFFTNIRLRQNQIFVFGRSFYYACDNKSIKYVSMIYASQ